VITVNDGRSQQQLDSRRPATVELHVSCA